jgi:hypothetical protein
VTDRRTFVGAVAGALLPLPLVIEAQQVGGENGFLWLQLG